LPSLIAPRVLKINVIRCNKMYQSVKKQSDSACAPGNVKLGDEEGEGGAHASLHLQSEGRNY
jgi:hypothetical protein